MGRRVIQAIKTARQSRCSCDYATSRTEHGLKVTRVHSVVCRVHNTIDKMIKGVAA